MTVVTLDLDLIVNIEAGVFPGKELVDQFPADLLFPEQHLKDLVAEEVSKEKIVVYEAGHASADWFDKYLGDF